MRELHSGEMCTDMPLMTNSGGKNLARACRQLWQVRLPTTDTQQEYTGPYSLLFSYLSPSHSSKSDMISLE